MSRILVIDDEAATRLVMQNRLRDLGYEVVAAENGAKGLLEARESPFDVVLVDAGLASGVDGYEVTKRLKQTPMTAGMPVVLFSKGSMPKEELGRGYEAGCEVFLPKQEMPILDHVLRVMLRHRSKQDDLTRQVRALEDANKRLQDERQQGADIETALKGTGEQALALREMAAGRPDGTLLVDADGVVRYADRGARDLLGGTLDGRNLGMLCPDTGLEAFVRDAHTEARDSFRFDLSGRGSHTRLSLTASVVPLVSNPGQKDPGLRVVSLVDTGKRRVAAELVRLQDYTIPRREVGPLVEAARVAFGVASVVGSSPAMVAVRQRIEESADDNGCVLILGAEGTGKQHVARALHFSSSRSGPFQTVDCASLEEEHLESELFGQAKGAFEGALVDRPGAFQIGRQGTILLQNVDALPKALQERVLEAIEQGTVRRAGSRKNERAKVRVVASSRRDLREVGFLPELVGALEGCRLELPPLAERREDIAELAREFLQRFGSGRARFEIGESALVAMERYEWPGNVRELASTIESACARAKEGIIQPKDLPPAVREYGEPLAEKEIRPSPNARVAVGALNNSHGDGVAERPYELSRPPMASSQPWDIAPDDPVSLELYEMKALLRALHVTGGDKLAAARLLKVGKSTLYRKLKRYDI